MLTHGNLLHNERAIQHAFRQTEESVILGWLPLYHDMGLVGFLLAPLACQLSLDIMRRAPSPAGRSSGSS